MAGRKKVLCSQCGFLCWTMVSEQGRREIELPAEQRRAFQVARIEGRQDYPDGKHAVILTCFRGQWHLLDAGPGGGGYLLDSHDLREPRHCPHFFRHHPGFSPEEHKDLQREQEVRRWKRRTALMAVAGAALGALGSFLYFLLSG